MRVVVTGAGGFVGAHVDRALRLAGHEAVDVVVSRERPHRLRLHRDRADVLIHLSPVQVRDALDVAWASGARLVVLLSVLGADPLAERPELSARGTAEELVRASGLPWGILRPEILWGPGDVFTNEIAHLLRHLPFIPAPRGSAVLAPVHAGDVARALVEICERPSLAGHEWLLGGPELLGYADILSRVAQAIGLGDRRRLAVPAWAVRWGVALEERLDRRPRVTRALLDRLVAGEGHADRLDPSLARASLRLLDVPERKMTVEALAYLRPSTLDLRPSTAST